MSGGINLLLWTAPLEAQDAGGLRALPDLGYGGVAVPSFTGNAAQARQGGDHLHRLADVAQERGASVIAGPMNLFELLVLTPEGDAAPLLAKVNMPNHHNLPDTVHAPTDGANPVQALRRTQPALAALHLSENHRGNPGLGHAALVPALQRLKAGAYDQRIPVEAIGQAMPQIAAATRNWRPLFVAPLTLASDAIAPITAHLPPPERTENHGHHRRPCCPRAPHSPWNGRRRTGRLYRRCAPHRRPAGRSI